MVKIFKLSKYVGTVAYGQAELAAQLIEEVKKRLEEGDKHFSQIFEKMRSTLREKYSSWLERLPLERKPAVGFIVAGFEENKDAKIYYLSSHLDFAPQLNQTGVALGGIPQYATYLTHRLYSPEMTTKQLVHLAVYVISETATQDPKVGGRVRVAEITWEKGYVELEESYINEVNRKNEEAHERLRLFFLGKGEEKE
jgi:20S proteasome alpha/beta subunit